MYAPQQMLRVHHEERLRQAETRRLVKQAAAESRGSARPGGSERRPLGLLRGLGRAARPA